MRQRRRTFAGRDQRASTFGAVLLRLCDAAGAMGAALVDAEGETVDYAGTIDPFEIKLAAAEFCVLLDVMRATQAFDLCDTVEVSLRGSRRSFYAHILGDGYAVVLVLMPHAFTISRRAIVEAVRDLCEEAGLQTPAAVLADERWFLVEARCESQHPRRPDAIWIAGAWHGLEILGVYGERSESREIGFRARLDSGAEITLVRERSGRWYADALPARPRGTKSSASRPK